MTSSAQLEREAEQTRTELTQTLDELRERMTPGQLVDQAVDYAKARGGGAFVRNLGQQATTNPMPVALIGAGIAWLMLSGGKGASINRAAEAAVDNARQSMADAGAQIGEFAQKTTEQIKGFGQEAGQHASDSVADASGRITNAREGFRERAEVTRSAAEQSSQSATSKASETASYISGRASSAYETAKSRASETYGRVADQTKQATSTMGSTISEFGGRTAGASRDFLQFCKSQPLMLAGLGLALGAIMGALIPPTETEDRLMGDTSDQMKDQARAMAEDQYENAKSAAETGMDQAQAQLSAETSLVPDVEQIAPSEPVEQDK
jgi:ElaB/YqjD/DUF883 family membrane-anchored ribosome-binding protein